MNCNPVVQVGQFIGSESLLNLSNQERMVLDVAVKNEYGEGTCVLCGDFGLLSKFSLDNDLLHQYFKSGFEEFFKIDEFCSVCIKHPQKVSSLHQQLLQNHQDLNVLSTTIHTVLMNNNKLSSNQGHKGGIALKKEIVSGLFEASAALSDSSSDACFLAFDRERPITQTYNKDPGIARITNGMKSGRRKGKCHIIGPLENHPSRKNSTRDIICRNVNCNEELMDGRQFRFHKKHCGIHPLVSYKDMKICYFCKRNFKYRFLLENHMRLHISERVRLKCRHCTESFLSSISLKSHTIRSHGTPEERKKLQEKVRERSQKNTMKYKIKSLKCYFCPLALPSMVYLARHMRLMHTLERAYYDCTKCRKSFRHKNQLKYHNILVCGTEQEAKLELIEKKREHRNRYIQKKANFLRCYFCGKQLSQTKSLEIHLGTHTLEGDSHNCRICKKRFVSQMFLEKHEVLVCRVDTSKEAEFKRRNAEKYAERKKRFPKFSNCSTCGQGIEYGKFFSHVNACNKKLSARRFCRKCNEMFPSWQEKKVHDRIKHGGEGQVWECYFCSKQFLIRYALETHFVTHTQEEFYKCEACGKRFKWVHGIKFHLRKKICEQAVLIN